MEKDLTPKPFKKNSKSKAPTESDGGLPAPPSKRVVRPALIEEEDDSSEEVPPAKENKGKGKEIQEADKATNKGADQTTRAGGGNIPKSKTSVLSHLIRIHHMSLLSLNETSFFISFSATEPPTIRRSFLPVSTIGRHRSQTMQNLGTRWLLPQLQGCRITFLL
jgi:hypothetical protein